jgi:ankyrin repeat protein
MLLARGANVNAQLKLRPPVRSALPGDRGADVRVLTTGATPLLRAAVGADLAAMDVLIKHGALLELPLADGTTPFFATVLTAGTRSRFKAEAQALAAMRMLKQAGADPHTRTAGSTPLLTATVRVWNDVIKELVSYGVDIGIDHHDVSRATEAEASPSPAKHVPRGDRVGFHGEENVDAVPSERQRHEVRLSVRRSRCNPNVGVHRRKNHPCVGDALL